MLCETCGQTFSTSSNLHQHTREKHSDHINSLQCSYCQRPFLRRFNLKRHLTSVHKLNCEQLEAAMPSKRRRVELDDFFESRKPVYVHSDLYEDISSDENDETYCDAQETDVTYVNYLDDISFASELPEIDESLVEDILHNCADFTSDRIVEMLEDESTDTREVIFIDEDSQPETSACDSDRDSEHQDTDLTQRSTICLVLYKTVKRNLDGTEEISRDSHIVYSEDLNPDDVDFPNVANEILKEVPKHFEDGHVRIVKGDISV
ncbi:centrosome-associated zinc finger protein Cp190-like [Saccostrea cucullata]|uniref:centrosome-associated zinc finger protein Cp190-like n=1 Tax=Saccostrea cuccullata TaxID=36930 RepID=UPI002ED53CAC